MDRSLIIRSLITSILNKDNDIFFKTNLQFFYDLEDGILRDNDLNVYFKKIISTTERNLLYNIFLNSYSSEIDILFFQNFNIQLEKYLKCDHYTADIEDIIFPIHFIFYRFFIKGGAALKVFVDNLIKLGIIGRDIPFVPNLAIDPTDIDSNIIANPAFPEALQLTVLLKQVINKVSFVLFEKYKTIYCKFNELLIEKIQKDDDFLKKISELFDNKTVFFTGPSSEQSNIELPNDGFSIKPENSCVRFTLLTVPICIVRLLMCLNINETNIVVENIGTGQLGIPNTNFLSLAEAEIIDITVYDLDNPKYNDIWNWAKKTLPYDSRHTLFQGVHDMIIDIIQMNTLAETTGNPSLLVKYEKRKSRLDYLYFLYCNYRLIQNLLENNNEINEEHINQYCHKLIEVPFLRLGLTKKQINDILPYIIGYTTINFSKIIINFIKNYIVVDQSFQYELTNKDGILISSKLDKSNYNFKFPDKAIKMIEDYINVVIPTLSNRSAALVFVNLVEFYKETNYDGNTLFILMSAILDAVGTPINLFVGATRNKYDNIIKSIKLSNTQLFLSNQYFQIIRKNPVPKNFGRYLLQDNIGKLCNTIIDQIQIWCNLVILNKYPPYKIICIPKIEVSILQLLENIFEIINSYLISLSVPYLLLYHLTPDYVINVYFRFTYDKTINTINVKGDFDLLFCRFILKYQNLPQNAILVYENEGNALYQNL